MDIKVIKLCGEHLRSTAELEEICFAHPWTEEGLSTLTRDGGVGFAVLGEDGKVVSYAGMVTAADEGSITNVATHPDLRRRGFSHAVMECLIEHSREIGLSLIALEVRVSNDAAIKLYKGLGFEIAGKRPRFYRTPVEDAYVMIKKL